MSWVSPPGDYAIVNSNHIPDGTSAILPHVLFKRSLAERLLIRGSGILPDGHRLAIGGNIRLLENRAERRSQRL